MRAFFVAVAALAVVLVASCGHPAAVGFPDSRLAEAIREVIGIEGRAIDRSDLRRLIELTAIDRGIVRLDGLEWCENLVYLDLGENHISDLTPLSGLRKLETLVLRSNRVTEASSLAGLT